MKDSESVLSHKDSVVHYYTSLLTNNTLLHPRAAFVFVAVSRRICQGLEHLRQILHMDTQ